MRLTDGQGEEGLGRRQDERRLGRGGAGHTASKIGWDEWQSERDKQQGGTSGRQRWTGRGEDGRGGTNVRRGRASGRQGGTEKTAGWD